MPTTKYDELYDGRVACTHRSYTAKHLRWTPNSGKGQEKTIQYDEDYALPVGGPAAHMAARPKNKAYSSTTL